MIAKNFAAFGLEYSVETDDMGVRVNMCLTALHALITLLREQLETNQKISQLINASDGDVDQDRLQPLVVRMADLTDAVYKVAAVTSLTASIMAGDDLPAADMSDIHPMPTVTQ